MADKIMQVAGSGMDVRSVEITAAADLTAPKTPLVLGTVSGAPAWVGVALASVLTGELVDVGFTETWRLPKTAGTAIGPGDPVDWDVSAGEAILSGSAIAAAGDVVGFGMCYNAAAAGDVWVDVELGQGILA